MHTLQKIHQVLKKIKKRKKKQQKKQNKTKQRTSDGFFRKQLPLIVIYKSY